jgi:hypothetical protein
MFGTGIAGQQQGATDYYQNNGKMISILPEGSSGFVVNASAVSAGFSVDSVGTPGQFTIN